MHLPVNSDDFREIIEKKFDFVDKTLWIQEILDEISVTVMAITRPRRFGKTLNLSMLHYFLAAEVDGRKTQGLFDGLKIAALGEKYMQHQGKYPVIFITFKEVRDHDFSIAYSNLINLLHRVYRQHNYLTDSPRLSPAEKEKFKTILERKGSRGDVNSALLDLSYYLYQHHGAKVWLLIDEYDTPIQSAFLNNYYDEVTSLMRSLLGAALKTNPYLERAVITGILRIAKESLFSGLNNIKVYSLLHSKYGEYFGFTEQEVTKLLTKANLNSQAETIRYWYNGYLAGDKVIYNPWSIVNCINEGGALQPYWVNTSSNDLIKRLLTVGDAALKENLELLLSGDAIEALIDENMVFGNLERDQYALWSLLLFSGYLKAIHIERGEGTYLKAQLVPPNYEVYSLYRGIIQEWFTSTLGKSNYDSFLNSLTRGDVEEFTLRLQDCLQDTFSIFDVTGLHPEKFYHGFVLGMMVSLQKTHEIQSNKESGYGRYDVMLIPKDPSKLGIVLEFKTVRDANIPLLEAAQEALQQIIDRNYTQTLRNKGIQQILQLGLAFRHKEVAVKRGA